MPSKPKPSRRSKSRRPPTHIGTRIDHGQPSPYLSLHELAAELRMSVKSALRHIRAGTFPPHVRLGRVFLFRREMVDVWLRSRESATGVAPRARSRAIRKRD